MCADEAMAETHRVWEDWAQADPLWAILSDPERKGGKWELPEFFASGVREIDLVLGQLEERDLVVPRGRCLDFGCGVGRLTQALAAKFDRSDGVDISETMIDLARDHNKAGDRCQYHVNLDPDLALFDDGSFDFVFSTIVLQHNPPDAAEHYITEFVRILTEQGIAVFDMIAELSGVTLPDHGHRCSLALTAPSSMAPGQKHRVRVSCTNDSSVDWPAGTRLAVGNHWRSGDGSEVVVQDDGRYPLPEGLAAGATAAVELVVSAPAKPGAYQLEVDLVEEGICWFGDKESPVVSQHVQVKEPSRRWFRRDAPASSADVAAGEPAPEPTPFEMNGLSRERVEAAVVRSGGEVVDVLTSTSGGTHWDGYRYFVRKAR